MKKIDVKAYNAKTNTFQTKCLILEENRWRDLVDAPDSGAEIYLSPGFIDSHAHVYPGVTDLGIDADRIGLQTGVHLIIDGGSAGCTTFGGLKDYVLPTFKTTVKVFLNISRVGLVTKHPYYDLRNLDVEAACHCIKEDGKSQIIGIKVLSSGIVLEGAGLTPMRKAIELSEKTGYPIMAHLVEGPPSNKHTMELLRTGDIITHCFHGAPNIAANKKATHGAAINPKYYSEPNIMWEKDGTPTPPLEAAIKRSVFLDVGHGAASFDKQVASGAIRQGFNNFSISTDAHIRNIDTKVYSLPFTMSKFLAIGMKLENVIASVTQIPEKHLGLTGWCDNLPNCATLFRLRSVKESEHAMLDSQGCVIKAEKMIEPIAVITDGEITYIGSQGHTL